MTFRYLVFFLPLMGLVWLLSYWMSIYMALATGAYFMMVMGVIQRKQKRLHMAMMLTAMLTDLSLVLVLEIQRSAIDMALSFDMSPLQQAHIVCSSLAVIFYFPTLVLGLRRFFSENTLPHLRVWHIRLGLLAFFFRSLGFLFMFSLL